MKATKIICGLAAIAMTFSGVELSALNGNDDFSITASAASSDPNVNKLYNALLPENRKSRIPEYEAAIEKIISEKVHDGMTDMEKIKAVLDVIASKEYSADSSSPLLDGHGDCMWSSAEGILLLNRLGYDARMRAANNDFGGVGTNHHNIWLKLNGKTYIVDCQAGLEYTDIIPVSDNMYLYCGHGLTDNNFTYFLLDDGTLEIMDVLLDTDDTAEALTFPTKVVFNNKEYSVSKIGNFIINTGYPQSKYNSAFNNYEYSLPYKKVVIPDGISFDNKLPYVRNIMGLFPNATQVVLGKDINWLSNVEYMSAVMKDSSIGSLKVIDGRKSNITNVPNVERTDWIATIEPDERTTFYTNVVNDKFYDFAAMFCWVVCDTSNPNNHTIKGNVSNGIDVDTVKAVDTSGVVYYPIVNGNSFEFAGMKQQSYTLYYGNNTKAVTLAAKDVDLGMLSTAAPHTHSYTSKVTKAATCTENGTRTYTCSCGDTYTETISAKGHTYTTKVVAPTYSSQGYTLHTCSVCGDSYKDNYTDKLVQPIIDDSSSVDDSSVVDTPSTPHAHSYTSKITKTATCTESGTRTYTCACGDTYTQSIPATGHTYTSKVVAPTTTSQGYTLHTCSVCGDSYKDNYTAKLTEASEKISILKVNASLSSKSIAYTGKAKMPKLTLTYNGKTLVKNVDYKVGVKNSKKVGKATIVITGIGEFTGKGALYYYVVPVKPTINSVKSSAAKKLTLKWKKNTMADGYQIQISTKSNFSSKTSYRISKNTTVKATISKLTSGKKYYVRMRSYKTIDGVRKFSAYSAVKSVKVK